MRGKNRTKELIGQTFGRLTVIKLGLKKGKKGETYWECRCSCGVIKEIRQSSLLGGKTRSCGCYQLERTTKHGKSYTRLYRILSGIKRRCNNPNNKGYRNYGERGIYLCDEWKDFISFEKWARQSGYQDNLKFS